MTLNTAALDELLRLRLDFLRRSQKLSSDPESEDVAATFAYLEAASKWDAAINHAAPHLLRMARQYNDVFQLARQAANGWGAFATRKMELKDISRIHNALDRLMEEK